jgi:hypothetical protein
VGTGYGSYGPPAPGAPPPARYNYGYGERGTMAGGTDTAPPERNVLRGDRG